MVWDDIVYATFGVPLDSVQETVWNEPTSSRRGLKRPASMQEGMLEFNPATVQICSISKFFSIN